MACFHQTIIHSKNLPRERQLRKSENILYINPFT